MIPYLVFLPYSRVSLRKNLRKILEAWKYTKMTPWVCRLRYDQTTRDLSVTSTRFGIKSKMAPKGLKWPEQLFSYGRYFKKKFLPWDFHILATQKNNFCHPGGSQWVPGGLLAHFRAKKGYFWTIFQKILLFFAF